MAVVETIYMPLEDEGTPVWAPAPAERVDDERFLILGPMPDDQEWRFKPGTIVRVAYRTFHGGAVGLTAIE